MIASELPPAEVVVTAPRPPDQSRDERLGAIVLDRDQIAQPASGRIEEILSKVAGLQSFRRSDSRSSNPTAQGLSLRGLGGNASSRTLILLDGIPIADPFFGYAPLAAIDPQRIDRITVLRGAGGGAFGSAVAGAIGLESVPFDDREPLDASLAASSGQALEITTGVAERLGSSLLMIDGRWDRGRGFWTTVADQRVPASVRARYDSRLGTVRLIAPVGSGALHANLRRFVDDRRLRFRGADVGMSGTDASVRYVSSDQSLSVAGWHQWRDFSNVVVSAASFRPVLDQYATPASSRGAALQWQARPWLAVGADFRKVSGTARERSLSADGAVTSDRMNGGNIREAALFAEAEVRTGALTLAGSGRLAAWRIADGRSIQHDGSGQLLSDQRFGPRSDLAISGRVSALWEGPDWSARVSAYRGVRVPTLNELYRGFTIFPVATLPNPLLKPERLNGGEVSVRVKASENLVITTTVFANRLADAIGNVTIGPNLRQRQNIEAIRSLGMEAEAKWRSGPWALDGSLSLVSARLREPGDLDGLRPSQVPRLSLTLTGTRTLGRSELSMSVRHVGKAYEDDLNQDRLPPATTVDIVARHRLNDFLEVAMRGENLLGEQVITRNQGGSIDLGAPRQVWISLSFRRRQAREPMRGR